MYMCMEECINWFITQYWLVRGAGIIMVREGLELLWVYRVQAWACEYSTAHRE